MDTTRQGPARRIAVVRPRKMTSVFAAGTRPPADAPFRSSSAAAQANGCDLQVGHYTPRTTDVELRHVMAQRLGRALCMPDRLEAGHGTAAATREAH